ncbi:MAG: hypothetical protein WKF73_10430 [Nocardioidaceae bacterium]
MTGAGPYELVLTPPAVRAVQAKLPETVAAAVIEFLNVPWMVRGKPPPTQLEIAMPMSAAGFAQRP